MKVKLLAIVSICAMVSSVAIQAAVPTPAPNKQPSESVGSIVDDGGSLQLSTPESKPSSAPSSPAYQGNAPRPNYQPQPMTRPAVPVTQMPEGQGYGS